MLIKGCAPIHCESYFAAVIAKPGSSDVISTKYTRVHFIGEQPSMRNHLLNQPWPCQSRTNPETNILCTKNSVLHNSAQISVPVHFRGDRKKHMHCSFCPFLSVAFFHVLSFCLSVCLSHSHCLSLTVSVSLCLSRSLSLSFCLLCLILSLSVSLPLSHSL